MAGPGSRWRIGKLVPNRGVAAPRSWIRGPGTHLKGGIGERRSGSPPRFSTRRFRGCSPGFWLQIPSLWHGTCATNSMGFPGACARGPFVFVSTEAAARHVPRRSRGHAPQCVCPQPPTAHVCFVLPCLRSRPRRQRLKPQRPRDFPNCSRPGAARKEPPGDFARAVPPGTPSSSTAAAPGPSSSPKGMRSGRRSPVTLFCARGRCTAFPWSS